MNTKHKGDVALTQAIAYYAECGYEILLPLGDKRPYDLVVEKLGKLYKVQSKYTSSKKPSGNYEVSLRITGGNQSFNSAKKYQPDDFDLLFVYADNGSKYEFPGSMGTNRNSISLGRKYDKFKVG